MKIASLFLLAASFLPVVPAFAQEWKLRPGDEVLDRRAAERMTNGRTLVFYDEGRSKFSPGGAYSYTYANGGGTAFGIFSVMDDGRVCIEFRNGFDRCDLYVRNKSLLVLLTEKGERFPVKVELEFRH